MVANCTSSMLWHNFLHMNIIFTSLANVSYQNQFLSITEFNYIHMTRVDVVCVTQHKLSVMKYNIGFSNTERFHNNCLASDTLPSTSLLSEFIALLSLVINRYSGIARK